MSASTDGKDNGSGGPPEGEDRRIIRFPTLAERDRMRKQRQDEGRRQDEVWRKEYREASQVPFFNAGKIPVFIGRMALAFILIHIGTSFLLDDGERLRLYASFGFTPRSFTDLEFSGGGFWQLAHLVSPVTYGFLHGNWVHLGFNIIMWLALGTFFESELGAGRTARFFLLVTLAGALLHYAVNPFSPMPVVGASAAISGFFAVVFISLYQRQLIGPVGKYGLVPVIAFWLLLFVFTGVIGGGNIAWAAHIGGFMAGVFYLSWIQTRSLKFWRL